MTDNHNESVKKLNKLTKGIRTAMLTTIDSGHLRARPMATQEMGEDGDLWFMTNTDSHKMAEIGADNRVNVSYCSDSDSTYVSISGTGRLVMDRAKIKEFWNPIYKAWFPDGVDDPNICLLKVTAEQAEYWDITSSKLVQLTGFIKAIVTHKEAHPGDHEKLDI